MKPWNIVHALQSTTKRTEKEEILSIIASDNENEFWKGAQLALDPLLPVHIKSLPTPETHSNGVDFATFTKVFYALHERSITGNKAKEVVQKLAEKCTEEQWELWYSRILKKDLRCGTNIKTINNVAPEKYQITEFGCQLAVDVNKVATHKLPTSAQVEAKYDGTRALFFIKKGEPVTAYSRNGIKWENFGIICDALEALIEFPDFPDCGVMVDGEVISKSFQDVAKQMRKKDNGEFNGMAMLFDILPQNEYWSQNTQAPLSLRRSQLEDFVSFLKTADPNSPVDISYAEKGINAQTEDDRIMELFTAMLEGGFEGIMIKDETAPYYFDRDATWLKLKPTDTYDMRVVGIEAGEPGKKYENTLGAIVVDDIIEVAPTPAQKKEIKAGKLVDLKLRVKSNISGGISDKLRKEIWNNPNDYIGAIAEIKVDAITKSDKNDYHSFRFGRLVKFRFDK
jgi:DNA ligase-1